jgi:hypothetical protein
MKSPFSTSSSSLLGGRITPFLLFLSLLLRHSTCLDVLPSSSSLLVLASDDGSGATTTSIHSLGGNRRILLSDNAKEEENKKTLLRRGSSQPTTTTTTAVGDGKMEKEQQEDVHNDQAIADSAKTTSTIKDYDESIVRCLLVASHISYSKSTATNDDDHRTTVIAGDDTSLHGIGLPSSHTEWNCQVLPESSSSSTTTSTTRTTGRLLRVQGLESWVQNFVVTNEAEDDEARHSRAMKGQDIKFVRKGSSSTDTSSSSSASTTTTTTSAGDCMSKVGIHSGETELVVSIRQRRREPAKDYQQEQQHNNNNSNILTGGTLHLGSTIKAGKPSGGANHKDDTDDDDDDDDDNNTELVDLVDRFSKESLLQSFQLRRQQQQQGPHNSAPDGIAGGGWGSHNHQHRRRNLLSSSGTKSTLVVRATIGPIDATTLSRAIFGNSSGTVSQSPPNAAIDGDWSMRGAIQACSHGQLDTKPATWPLSSSATFSVPVVGLDQIQNGVISVDIGTKVPFGRYDAMTALWFGAEALLGLGLNGQYLENTFDIIMFCLPPGTEEGWIAEGWVNHPFSLYNNDWCKYPSAMMHELGHNLNLDHARDVSQDHDYGDQTGVMGTSMINEDGPKMCYNTANSYHLGWYRAQQLDWDPITQGNVVTRLVGIVDYNPMNTDQNTNVIVRLGPPSDDAGYFIGYNKAEGINAGTMEGQNMVTVTRYGGLSSDGKATMTDLLTLLYEGDEYRIVGYNNGSSVVVDLIIRWTSTTNTMPLVEILVAP